MRSGTAATWRWRSVSSTSFGDRAYDSDPLDEGLRREPGVELIAPPEEEMPAHARWTATAPLENRAAVCLAEKLPPAHQPLGTLRRQLPRHGSTRLRVDSVETFMRLLVDIFGQHLLQRRIEFGGHGSPAISFLHHLSCR